MSPKSRSLQATSSEVNKVWVVGDVGSQIVNPSGAEAQVQGGVIDGLSEVMDQQITLEAGRVVQQNYNQHTLLRLRHTPTNRSALPEDRQSAHGSRRTLSAAGAAGGLQRHFRGIGPPHSRYTAFDQRLYLGIKP